MALKMRAVTASVILAILGLAVFATPRPADACHKQFFHGQCSGRFDEGFPAYNIMGIVYEWIVSGSNQTWWVKDYAGRNIKTNSVDDVVHEWETALNDSNGFSADPVQFTNVADQASAEIWFTWFNNANPPESGVSTSVLALNHLHFVVDATRGGLYTTDSHIWLNQQLYDYAQWDGYKSVHSHELGHTSGLDEVYRWSNCGQDPISVMDASDVNTAATPDLVLNSCDDVSLPTPGFDKANQRGLYDTVTPASVTNTKASASSILVAWPDSSWGERRYVIRLRTCTSTSVSSCGPVYATYYHTANVGFGPGSAHGQRSSFTQCPPTNCDPFPAYDHERTLINLPSGRYNVTIAADNVTAGESAAATAGTVVTLP